MTGTLALIVGLASTAIQATPPSAPQKIEIVSSVGCLKLEGTNDWRLINATDPTPSRANTPAPDQVPKEPTAGKNQFKLIGVSEFPLNDKKDKTVYVRGLYIKATPMNRINITSVTVVSAACLPAK